MARKTSRKILWAALASAFFIYPAQAAEGIKFKPYLGLDLQRMNIAYDNNFDKVLSDGLNGGNIHAGIKFSQYFGLELGYFRMKEGKESVGFDLSGVTGTPGDIISSTKIRAQGLTLDAMGYLPLNDKFDLIGTAGISWTKADLSVSGTAYGTAGTISDDGSDFGYRLGVGAQYHITDDLNVRGLARYQDMNFDVGGFDAAEGAWVYTLGLNYSF